MVADQQLSANYFPLPPPGASTPQMAQWGAQITTALRRLQRAGVLGTSSEVVELEAQFVALNEQLTALQLQVDQGQPAGLTEQQAFILSLVSATGVLLGSIAEAQATAFEWAQRAARSAGLAMVRGHVDRGFGRTIVINEQTVRRTETSELAQSIQALNASLQDVEANVTVLQQAYVDGDAALAQQVTAVSTQVAGNTASVTQLQESVDGVSARWGVSISLQGHVVGLVQLDGGASGSAFSVVADKFLVALPGGEAEPPVPIFATGLVNGAPTIVLRGDVLADGAITARALDVDDLSAINANLGTVTAGRLQSADGKFVIDLDLKEWALLV